MMIALVCLGLILVLAGALLLTGAMVRQRDKIAYPDARALIIPHDETDIDGRFLRLEGAFNARDIGGYMTADGRRVRMGRVYRTGRLSDLTASDYTYLSSLGIRLVCDLRSDDETRTHPNNLPEGIDYRHFPINDDTPPWRRLISILYKRETLSPLMRDLYTRLFLDQNARQFGHTLRRLADEGNLPAIVHCNAGKDRAGIATALLLLVLGVPEETVIADYTLSNHAYDHFRAITAPRVTKLRLLNTDVDDLFPLLAADASIMRAALDHVTTHYGSVQAYLTAPAGLDDSVLQRLRDNLLE